MLLLFIICCEHTYRRCITLARWMVRWLKNRVKAQKRDTPRGHVSIIETPDNAIHMPSCRQYIRFMLPEESLRTRSQILHLPISAASACEQNILSPLLSPESHTAHNWLPPQLLLLFPKAIYGSCGPLQMQKWKRLDATIFTHALENTIIYGDETS